MRGSSFQLPILIVAGWLARLPYTSGPTTVLINAGDACYTSNRSDVDRYWVYRCTIRSNKRAADRHTRCLTVFCVPAGNWLNIGVDISRHTIRYDTRCCFTGRLKTQVRICNGGKRKYSNLKSILKSLRFSSLAFSVDPLSVGLDQFSCTVPDRCYTQEIGLMMDSCAEGPGFKNRRRDAV